jgi:ATP-dependent DNA helicase RecQ
MQTYVSLQAGHMAFLIQSLDGDPSNASPSRAPSLPISVDPALVREAVDFLRQTNLPIAPRKQWPAGGLPQFAVKGKIRPEHQAQPGKALCVWGDAGWGTLVRHGKYTSGRFDDQLVAACIQLVRIWNPQPAPAWVTCVPSLRHPTLVRRFAESLAQALALPFFPILMKTDERPEQKAMSNSAQQARNVDGCLAVDGAPRPGPVLLIDDMVDSGWTLTVSAWLLRSGGSGKVWPLALAQAGGGE